jgi:hypothetical protein
LNLSGGAFVILSLRWKEPRSPRPLPPLPPVAVDISTYLYT